MGLFIWIALIWLALDLLAGMLFLWLIISGRD
jgi:hypothetical protein